MKREPQATLPKLTEAEFQSQVNALLDLEGWDYIHIPDSRQVQATLPGLTDIIAFRPPRKLAIELKVRPNKPTSEQLYWLETMRLCGFEVYVIYPDDWEWLKQILQKVLP